MSAHRAGSRGSFSLEYKTAVQAHPLLFHIRYKEFSFPNQLRVPAEPVSVYLLDIRNLDRKSVV